MTKKVTLISQGCRLNHAETAQLINEFSSHGFEDVALTDDPDIVVVNTCTVTENGDKDTIRLIHKINAISNAKIALIGCQSQIKKEQLLSFNNVQWVIGNENKSTTVHLICSNNQGLHVAPFNQAPFTQKYSSFDPRHTRVNLKVQDGCNFYCAFCIIPFARGPARSRAFNNILTDATALIQLGVKELVLTGINLGTYQHNSHAFTDVLEALLTIRPDVRIRISSIEPTTIDDTLIDLWKKYPNFCRHLHIPIQSATNAILSAMRRKYTVSEFNDYIQTVRSALPNCCIGTDVIVGFPGETTQLFSASMDYLSTSPINYFHVFSYSERRMAHARKFDQKIDAATIKHRSNQCRELSRKKWDDFNTSFIGTTMPVLFEQEKKGHWVGSSEHFLKVAVTHSDRLKNQVRNVTLNALNKGVLHGTIIE